MAYTEISCSEIYYMLRCQEIEIYYMLRCQDLGGGSESGFTRRHALMVIIWELWVAMNLQEARIQEARIQPESSQNPGGQIPARIQPESSALC